MNNIETLTPSTFICLPKVTVLWLMIISLFLLQFYNMYYLFSVLVLTMVYLVLSQVFVELHTVLSLPMSDTDIAVICDTWIKSLHIFLMSRIFFWACQNQSPMWIISSNFLSASVDYSCFCQTVLWEYMVQRNWFISFFLSLCWFLCRL